MPDQTVPDKLAVPCLIEPVPDRPCRARPCQMDTTCDRCSLIFLSFVVLEWVITCWAGSKRVSKINHLHGLYIFFYSTTILLLRTCQATYAFTRRCSSSATLLLHDFWTNYAADVWRLKVLWIRISLCQFCRRAKDGSRVKQKRTISWICVWPECTVVQREDLTWANSTGRNFYVILPAWAGFTGTSCNMAQLRVCLDGIRSSLFGLKWILVQTSKMVHVFVSIIIIN